MIRRPPRSTLSSSSAASDVYKRPYQHRGTLSCGQARRWPQSPTLGRRWREQRMDVGRAARRRPQRHAAVPDRPGPASRHPRPDADRDPATTAPGRARPAHLARPRSDPATTTRPAEPAGRPGPAAGTPRTHLTAQPYPNEQGPGDTDPDVGCFCTPTPTRTMQRQRSRRPEQDHSVSGGSRSDRSQFYRDLAFPFYGANRDGSTVSQGARDAFWLMSMTVGIKGAFDCVQAFSETDLTEDLKKIDVPTLILHGDDDQIVPIGASALKSSKIVANATLKIYPGAPHGLTGAHEQEFNKYLLAFVTS